MRTQAPPPAVVGVGATSSPRSSCLAIIDPSAETEGWDWGMPAVGRRQSRGPSVVALPANPEVPSRRMAAAAGGPYVVLRSRVT